MSRTNQSGASELTLPAESAFCDWVVSPGAALAEKNIAVEVYQFTLWESELSFTLPKSSWFSHYRLKETHTDERPFVNTKHRQKFVSLTKGGREFMLLAQDWWVYSSAFPPRRALPLRVKVMIHEVDKHDNPAVSLEQVHKAMIRAFGHISFSAGPGQFTELTLGDDELNAERADAFSLSSVPFKSNGLNGIVAMPAANCFEFACKLDDDLLLRFVFTWRWTEENETNAFLQMFIRQCLQTMNYLADQNHCSLEDDR